MKQIQSDPNQTCQSVTVIAHNFYFVVFDEGFRTPNQYWYSFQIDLKNNIFAINLKITWIDNCDMSIGVIRLRADKRCKRSRACCSTAITNASWTALPNSPAVKRERKETTEVRRASERKKKQYLETKGI